jgi:hypothetical protein
MRDTKNMDYVIAVSLIVSMLFCLHLCAERYQKWRRYASTKLKPNERVIMIKDSVSIHVRTDDSISSTLKAGMSFRGEGRIVLTEERLILGSSIGRLLEISHEFPGVVRAMGRRRLLIKGTHPSKKGILRIELVIDDEEEWAQRTRVYSRELKDE